HSQNRRQPTPTRCPSTSPQSKPDSSGLDPAIHRASDFNRLGISKLQGIMDHRVKPGDDAEPVGADVRDHEPDSIGPDPVVTQSIGQI
ncbi:hypothetical protein, partial [Rhodobium orientis]|uniref:hypothetical protein n=1 Tax=Rhodobium orientis TaxID=34017 RepID=UPI001AECE731